MLSNYWGILFLRLAAAPAGAAGRGVFMPAFLTFPFILHLCHG